jgi:hypothetical protein
MTREPDAIVRISPASLQEIVMRKLLLMGLAAGALSLAALTQASAAMPAENAIAAAATVLGDTIAVQQKWKKRPPGWDRGRKVGWRGGSMPPGQRKKLHR